MAEKELCHNSSTPTLEHPTTSDWGDGGRNTGRGEGGGWEEALEDARARARGGRERGGGREEEEYHTAHYFKSVANFIKPPFAPLVIKFKALLSGYHYKQRCQLLTKSMCQSLPARHVRYGFYLMWHKKNYTPKSNVRSAEKYTK